MMTWVKKSGLQSENVANFKKKKKENKSTGLLVAKILPFFSREKYWATILDFKTMPALKFR